MDQDANLEPQGNLYWIMPRLARCLFIGRTELIERMKNTLIYDKVPQGKQQRFVITGPGGQGKSETCIYFANQVREQYVFPSDL